MAANSSENANPTGGQPNPGGEHHVPITFEDQLHQFWQKNRTIVFGLCVFVLLAILGKGGWELMQRSKEREIQAAYQAANTPEKRRAFIAAHSGHELAGVAELQLADEAYAAGKAADAVAGYEKAASILKNGPLAARAKLGRALAKIQSGKAADGANELKLLADDSAQFKALRAEAAYHLANLSLEAGNHADAQKYIDQLNQIDPASMWARRAMALQSSLPRPAAPAAEAAPSAAPGVPNVQVKLPGK